MLVQGWLFVLENFATTGRVELELVRELGQASIFERLLSMLQWQMLICRTKPRSRFSFLPGGPLARLARLAR